MSRDNEDILVAVARLEGKVDALLLSRGDHEARLRSLERAKFWLLGAAAGVGFLAQLIGARLLEKV